MSTAMQTDWPAPLTQEEPELYRIWRDAGGGDWPALFSIDAPSIVNSIGLRSRCVRQFAWAIPTNAILNLLVPHAPFVEIGAGTGYWSSLLQARGATVTPYDRDVAGDHEAHPLCDVDAPFTVVHKGGPESAVLHPDCTLLLIWPPYATSMAHDALRAYAGETVVYIGEGEGGCTGDDAFHDLLEAEWEMVAEHPVPQWYGLHDYLWIYRRIPTIDLRPRLP